MIREDLISGRLVQLDLDAYEQGSYNIYAIRKTANPPGPAASWMIDAFRERLSNCPSDLSGIIPDMRHEVLAVPA
ncbi:hypothetical protein D3C87_2078840 [compost metagenome]